MKWTKFSEKGIFNFLSQATLKKTLSTGVHFSSSNIVQQGFWGTWCAGDTMTQVSRLCSEKSAFRCWLTRLSQAYWVPPSWESSLNPAWLGGGFWSRQRFMLCTSYRLLSASCSYHAAKFLAYTMELNICKTESTSFPVTQHKMFRKAEQLHC